MHDRLARFVVRCSAWLAPRDYRARWREEWLAEIGAPPVAPGPRAAVGQHSRRRLLTRALGAPLDAVLLRLAPFDRAFFASWTSDLREIPSEWRHAPVRSAVTVVVLTAGLAAAFVVFAVVNFWVAGELVGIRDRSSLARVVTMRGSAVLDPTLEEFRLLAAAPTASIRLAAATRSGKLAFVGGEPLPVEAQAVSADFFDVLGTIADRGRLLHASDNDPTATPAAVISHALWQRQFGGRADVIGRVVSLASAVSSEAPRPYSIVGVAPRGFAGFEFQRLVNPSDRPIVWVSFTHAPLDSGLGPKSFLATLGRIATSTQSVAAELNGRISGTPDRLASGSSPRTVRLLPFLASPVAKDPLETVLSGALFVSVPLALVLLVCVNVAAIRLAGSAERMHELAVRASLGASRVRLVRLLTTEAAALAAISSLAAWQVAGVAIRWTRDLVAMTPPDWRMLIFAVALASGIAIAAGLLPALRVTGPRTLPALAAGSSRVTGSRLRGYRWLTAVQMGLSLALLISGALGVRTVQSLTASRFDVSGVSLAQVTVADPALGPGQRRPFLAGVQRTIETFPGVESSAVSTMGPFSMGTVQYDVEGGRRPGDLPRGGYAGVHGGVVSGSYFQTLGFKTLEGRTFTEADGPAVAVVSDAFRHWLPANRPVVGTRLGHVRVRGEKRVDVEIVGVVSNGISLVELRHPTARTPLIFLPLGADAPADVTFFARSPVPDDTARRLAELASPGARLLINRAGTLQDSLAEQHQPLVWVARVLGAAAVVALIISAMGLWAVASAGVARRRREFGVRLAVGATPTGIARLLLQDTIRVTGLGALIGLVIVVPILFAMQGEMAVSAWDSVAWVVSILVLTGAAFAATIGPALRAMRVDPLEILRVE